MFLLYHILPFRPREADEGLVTILRDQNTPDNIPPLPQPLLPRTVPYLNNDLIETLLPRKGILEPQLCFPRLRPKILTAP